MFKKRQTWFGMIFVAALLLQVIAAGAVQAVDVKVYAFKCGILKTQTQYLIKDTRIGTPYDIPVPFFIIKHGKDWVAFDTGNNAKVAVDATNYWGEGIVKAYTPVMKPEEAFTEQIKKLGLTPKDFRLSLSAMAISITPVPLTASKEPMCPSIFRKPNWPISKNCWLKKKKARPTSWLITT